MLAAERSYNWAVVSPLPVEELSPAAIRAFFAWLLPLLKARGYNLELQPLEIKVGPISLIYIEKKCHGEIILHGPGPNGQSYVVFKDERDDMAVRQPGGRGLERGWCAGGSEGADGVLVLPRHRLRDFPLRLQDARAELPIKRAAP